MKPSPDVIVIGAGASGLLCAITAAKAGCSVLVLEKGPKIGLKILVSGGGRCNFTNTGADPRQHYLSQNTRFCLSAMGRYQPRDFIALVNQHGIAWHEKKSGQLFCDTSAKAIVAMLQGECDRHGVDVRCMQEVTRVEPREAGGYTAFTENAQFSAPKLVIASGGLSLPKVASDIAFRICRQLGEHVVTTRPALVPLTWNNRDRDRFVVLSGISLDAALTLGKAAFRDHILFTHRGLSGPGVLQISSFWREGDSISIDLLPGMDPRDWLRTSRNSFARQNISTVLAKHLPNRLVDAIEGSDEHAWFRDGRMGEMSNRAIDALTDKLNNWQFTPGGSEGYRTAEVTLGGIDTAALSSQSFEFKAHPGLYAIGEAIDVTGWLGGYNFQWAWASGWCCGKALAADR